LKKKRGLEWGENKTTGVHESPEKEGESAVEVSPLGESGKGSYLLSVGSTLLATSLGEMAVRKRNRVN